MNDKVFVYSSLDIKICHTFLSTGSISMYHHIYTVQILDICSLTVGRHWMIPTAVHSLAPFFVCPSWSAVLSPSSACQAMPTDNEIRSRSTILIHLAPSLWAWHLFLPGFCCVWSSSLPRLLCAWGTVMGKMGSWRSACSLCGISWFLSSVCCCSFRWTYFFQFLSLRLPPGLLLCLPCLAAPPAALGFPACTVCLSASPQFFTSMSPLSADRCVLFPLLLFGDNSIFEVLGLILKLEHARQL